MTAAEAGAKTAQSCSHRTNRSALSKVSSAGGTPQPLTTLDKQAGEATQRWPQVLPGGKAVLFTSNTPLEQLRGRRHRRVLDGFRAAKDGAARRLLCPLSAQRARGLYARRHAVCRAVRSEAAGGDRPARADPRRRGHRSRHGGAQFSFSETGNLVYVAGRGGVQNVSIYWMDREGKFTPLRETPGDYYNPAFSPDGKRLALEINDGKRIDIWVYEWERDTLTRLTFAGEANGYPVWTPDGQRIAYSSQEKGGTYNLWWIRADGAGNAQRLTESKYPQYARSWRPDGKVLAFRQINPDTGNDIMTLPIEGDEKSGWKPGEPKPFVNSAFSEQAARLLTRWPLARLSCPMNPETTKCTFGLSPARAASGRFPPAAASSQVVAQRQGAFLSHADSKIMVVTYTASGDSFRADKPQLWSPGQFTDLGLVQL